MADAIFEHSALVAVYDAFEEPRDDLDLYVEIADEFNAAAVIDLGCGTGVLARKLAQRGLRVVGIDPAAKSLGWAQESADAQSLDIEWRQGTSTLIGSEEADLITMTANVAQVFLSVDDLAEVFNDCARGLRHGGRLVFESRVPAARAWEAWSQRPPRTLNVEGIGDVTVTTTVGQVEPPFVAFTHLYRFHETNETIGSRSRLRFHTEPEITSALKAAGFTVDDVRDAPDRPGREWVFIASKT